MQEIRTAITPLKAATLQPDPTMIRDAETLTQLTDTIARFVREWCLPSSR